MNKGFYKRGIMKLPSQIIEQNDRIKERIKLNPKKGFLILQP